uniref:Pre-tRNA-processing protein n=2 Tax=Podospora anserina (strain S / ATCC MYA-4624 / DSM 980 / FGSC 10383) TaxID=515849 RepID=A0A090C8I7_PODAN|nr:Putative Pre-tRNA-processing protein [Podospora anserina S mat+]
MASTPAVPIEEQLKQLNAARKLALENSAYYDRIVKGVLPVIGPTSSIELKRWGAEFLAESLATPVLSMRDKESLTLSVLDTLKSLLESEQDDAIVLKASIAAAASAYPVVLRWIIHNSYHTEAWEQTSAIKSRILRIWDGAPAPVRLSCIKFAQRVVLAQTTSNGQEVKYGGLDISLGMVPANHPLLDPRLMEAEATGLLDRMLGVLQDNSNDALLVDATLNCLSILIRTRPSTSNRIINCVLNFNPLKLANSPMTPKNKVLMKSMEKTTRMLMINILKRHVSSRDPNNQHSGRVQQYVERLMRSRAEIFDEAGRKRQLADQAAAQYGDLKRQKMQDASAAAPEPAAPAQPAVIPPLAPGPQTLAAVFTLTNNPGLQAFDATSIPANLVAKIVARTLNTLDQSVLDFAVNGIRSRLHTLQAAAVTAAAQYAAHGAAGLPGAINPATAPLGVEEDDDDYEPNLDAAEDTEQILNKLDNAPPETALDEYADPNAALGLGPFTLAPPPLIDADVASKLSSAAASRLFGPLSSLSSEGPSKKPKAGINRLAASSYDRDSWLTVATRLATRSTFGLEEEEQEEEQTSAVKSEEGAVSHPLASTFNQSIREMLFTYILEDWRPRIEVAVAWLSEEWYNDQLTKRTGLRNAPLHYETWALRLLDGFMTFITAQDKVLTRFLAEIPELSGELLGRLKTLCGDPNTLGLAMTSLLYLVMMRPPARELALDTVGGIWVEYEEARPLAAKYLSKWRPGWVEQQMHLQAAKAVAGGGGNGAAGIAA